MIREWRCGNCRFWEQINSGDVEGGECRIRAPQHTLGSFHRSSDLESAVAMLAYWPNTGETDWCGEWQGDD